MGHSASSGTDGSEYGQTQRAECIRREHSWKTSSGQDFKTVDTTPFGTAAWVLHFKGMQNDKSPRSKSTNEYHGYGKVEVVEESQKRISRG